MYLGSSCMDRITICYLKSHMETSNSHETTTAWKHTESSSMKESSQLETIGLAAYLEHPTLNKSFGTIERIHLKLSNGNGHSEALSCKQSLGNKLQPRYNKRLEEFVCKHSLGKLTLGNCHLENWHLESTHLQTVTWKTSTCNTGTWKTDT